MPPRARQGGGGSASRSGASAAKRGAKTYLPWPNALVQPVIDIQDGADPTSSRIHIPAVETWVDFDELRRCGGAAKSTSVTTNGHAHANGKRKAENSHEPTLFSTSPPHKKVKRQDADEHDEAVKTPPPPISLFSTSLRFNINASQDREDISNFQPLAQCTIPDVQLTQRAPLSALEADILYNDSAIEVTREDGSLPLAILPMVNSLSDTFPQDSQPWKFTNGSWLPAALRLASAGILTLSSSMHVQDDDGGSLRLDVHAVLGPQAAIVDHSTPFPHTNASRHATDIMQLARFFASIHPTQEEDEAHRRRTLDASAVYSILSPASVNAPADLFQPIDLSPTLLPFQRRSTAFLLAREGRQVVDNALVDVAHSEFTSHGPSELGIWWFRITDSLYCHCLTGAFATSAEATRRLQHINGALLAEEMGLGKTVEILALVLLHSAPKYFTSAEPYTDTVNEVLVQPVKTTLIVCPALLQDQWVDEIQRHAPALKVYSFHGHVKAERDAQKSAATWHEFAKDFDIIVVAFNTLQKELSVAIKEAPRSRRAPRKYERPRCPLIQLQFFRVVCDEIQMVGNTTNAAEVVSMIPRVYSIAVSGTPVKRINDLFAFFRFLRIDGVHPSFFKEAEASKLFAPHLFKALQSLTTRHLKSAVKDELILPRQHRYVMPIDFTAVETAYYEDVWTAALGVLGLDSSGGPTRGDWQLDESLMRRQLLLLRQACTHPQVAGRVLGSGTMAQGNLRTMAEVLSYMKEQAIADMYKARNVATHKAIDRVVVLLQNKTDSTRFEIAQAILQDTITTLQADRQVLERDHEAAMKEGPGYRFMSEEVREHLKTKDEDVVVEARDPREIARNTHRLAIAQRLRLRLEHLARAAHWLGNLFYQHGELLQDDVPRKEALKKKEDDAYDLAEDTRQHLLRETRETVDKTNASLRRLNVPFGERQAQDDAEPFESAGIRSARDFEYIKERLELLNENSTVLFAWRKKILDALYTAVNRQVSAENEDDDQYAEALDVQHNAEVLLQTYRPLLARRQAIVSEQVAVGSTAAPASMKDLETVLKIARQSRRKAQLLGRDDTMAAGSEGEGLTFEQQALGEIDAAKLEHYRRLCQEMDQVSLESLPSEKDVKAREKAQRAQLLQGDENKDVERVESLGSLTNMQSRLRRLVENGINKNEEAIVQQGQQSLRAILKHQNTVMDGLRRELEAMARVFNARAEYFKQLQALSDALVDVEVPEGKMTSMLSEMQNERDAALVTAGKQESRLRYLDYLGRMEAEGLDAEARKCVICTDEIDIGLLLSGCGHIVCQKCFTSWYSHNRTCPICRAKIAGPRDYHRIVFARPEEDEAGDDADADAATQRSGGTKRKSNISFNVAPMQLRRQIESVPCQGRYGSKLEMLVRHLLYINRENPGEKTIVFSAFPRGLELVSDALRQNGLRYIHVTGSGGSANTAELVRRFTQGATDVLLLHSEATSAGLNLMATKNIIMLEPLVNSGAERQALGRVHRIGQTKETNVFVYYVRDSVEDRILRLAANRGQSLFLRSDDAELDSGQVIADTSSASANKERGDYVNSTDDLLSCFFAEHLGDERGDAAASGNGGGGSGSSHTEPSTTTTPSSVAAATRPMTDAEHARAARLEALDRRELAVRRQQEQQQS